ncbi:MAG TPA: hypothetical protein PL151_14705 [Phycisphaerae bacterium]|nr:hypothetical protein [Phycisphaerae bacterium]HOJ76066.1 hypothetical protein [Phycisphaerae bacterium]HOM53439.1 hypothetical protein [Phycisphaerae bacterium]HOQ86868.1 hypothetical protein [Phycisphaerae bacterium]HPP28715.1 hypothetical protein [Phycisphaerae bacterium]
MIRNVWLVAAIVAVASAGPPTLGQHYIQGGNVLDANNRIGSGGLNYGGPVFRPNSTNRIVTGNVTGGRAFRGYSPIRDPNSFYLGASPSGTGLSGTGLIGGEIGSLPSDRLSTYRRDSVDINTLRRLSVAPTATALPYYPQSSTVLETGQILRGLNRPGTSELLSSYVPLQTNFYTQPVNPLDASRNRLVGAPLSVDSRLVRVETGNVLTGPVNRRLLDSSLFGSVRQVPLSQIAGEAGVNGVPTVNPRAGLPDRAARTGEQQRLDGTDGSLQDRGLTPRTADPWRTPSILGEPGTGDQPTGLPSDGTQARLSRRLGEPEVSGDTATGTLARPLGQPEEAATGQNALRRGLGPVEGGPLPLFTGQVEERTKKELDAASELLANKQYYDAASRFERAHATDLRNPLPLLGRGMALLAAGDYTSSVNSLFLAFDMAGPQAVEIDLKPFTPDLEILDRRRAFLEKQLDIYEDFRLRFLLGWAEYVSGMREPGIKNMQEAAKAAPASMDKLRQFVDALAARQSLEPRAPATQPG